MLIIVIAPSFSEMSSDFDEILYAVADQDRNNLMLYKNEFLKIRYRGGTSYW